MRRDTTEFRNRFQKWKNGEQVYENGLVSASYQDGKENESEFPFGDQWLKEVTVYPTTLSLQTHYPIVSRYLPGHSVLFGCNDNTGDHFVISKRPNDPGYNFVTNNCSDDTRKALEAATGNMIRPFLFTTPGDVQDFFRQQYPDFKERKSRNGVKTLTANVSPIEFSRAKEIADSLSDINREKRRQDLKRWYQEALRRRVNNKDSLYQDGKEAKQNKYEISFAQPKNYEELVEQDPLGYHGKEAGALLGRIHALKKLEEQTGPIDFYDPNKRKGSRMKKKLYNTLYNSGGIVPWPTDPDMDYTGSYWYNSGNADVESNWRIFKKSSEYGGRNAVKQRNLLDMYVYKEPTGLKYLRDDSYVLGGDTLYKGPYYEGKIYPLGSDSVYNITKYAKQFIDSLISKNLTIPVNLNNLPLDRNRFPEQILDNVRHAKLKPVVDEKGNYYFKASKLWDLSGSLTFGNTVDKVNKLLGGSPFILEQKIPIKWDNDDLHEYNTDWNYIKKTIVDPNNDTGYKYGKESGIHIKPSHRGRLTALKKRTGKSEAELYKNGSAAVRKMITFARNARKWKH